MKAIIVLLAVVLLTGTGCAHLDFESSKTENGVTTTAKVSYTRLGTTTASLNAQVGDAKLKMSGQKIDSSFLSFLSDALKAAEKDD